MIQIDADSSQALAALAQRSMQLQCALQDGQIWLGANDNTMQIDPRFIKTEQN